MIKSILCDILGIEKPIFQGGMAWIADARLAAAVSNAGGLGLISSINFGADAVRDEIRKAKELTDKPFGVNIMLAAPNAPEIAELVVEEDVRILTTGAGSPAPYMAKWLEAGIQAMTYLASALDYEEPPLAAKTGFLLQCEQILDLRILSRDYDLFETHRRRLIILPCGGSSQDASEGRTGHPG